MNGARFLVAVLIVLGAALAACSGNFGSGTTPPGGLLPSGNLAGINPTPSPTPNSASNIVSYGTSADFQPLPNVAGYGGAVAFPVPSPKLSAEVAVGATLSVVRPEDAPDLNLLTKGKQGKKRERPARALAYLTLLATHDITLEAYPRIAIDVPREIVTIYRENELGLALYNSGAKDETFKLAVAQLDTATPPPTPTPNPSAPPPPTAIPISATASPSPTASGSTATASPSARPSGAASGPPTPAAPTASPTLPPQRVVFAPTLATLKMTANRAVVFALYALPVATPSPNPHASASASGSAAESTAVGSAAPVASGSPLPAGSPVATGSPSPAPTST